MSSFLDDDQMSSSSSFSLRPLFDSVQQKNFPTNPPKQQQQRTHVKVPHYIDEIANYSADDVRIASTSRIDDETGFVYGPVNNVLAHTTFNNYNDLVRSGIHQTALGSMVPHAIGYFEQELRQGNRIVHQVRPACSIIMYDTEYHEDRNNVVLFRSPVRIQSRTDALTTPYLERANAAISLNIDAKIPLRLTRARLDTTSYKSNPWMPDFGYRYDGLYLVRNYTLEPEEVNSTTTTWIVVFKLVKIYSQASADRSTLNRDTFEYYFNIDPQNRTDFAPFMPSIPPSTTTPLPSLSSMNYFSPTPPVNTTPSQMTSTGHLSHDSVRNMLSDLRRKTSTSSYQTPSPYPNYPVDYQF